MQGFRVYNGLAHSTERKLRNSSRRVRSTDVRSLREDPLLGLEVVETSLRETIPIVHIVDSGRRRLLWNNMHRLRSIHHVGIHSAVALLDFFPASSNHTVVDTDSMLGKLGWLRRWIRQTQNGRSANIVVRTLLNCRTRDVALAIIARRLRRLLPEIESVHMLPHVLGHILW